VKTGNAPLSVTAVGRPKFEYMVTHPFCTLRLTTLPASLMSSKIFKLTDQATHTNELASYSGSRSIPIRPPHRGLNQNLHRLTKHTPYRCSFSLVHTHTRRHTSQASRTLTKHTPYTHTGAHSPKPHACNTSQHPDPAYMSSIHPRPRLRPRPHLKAPPGEPSSGLPRRVAHRPEGESVRSR
jgi:hypothetical protein